MDYFTEFTGLEKPCVDYETIRTNKKVTYINLACGMDIETTSVIDEGEKHAFMYIWMVGLGHGEKVYYGRTWEELSEFCAMLNSVYQLSDERNLVIYVHNLGYEFQFMRKYFNWVSVFAVGDRKPVKALCDYGIEFRDSYILSGYSLANTAKNLAFHKVEKMEGDLDYSLVRHHKTPLTEKEMKYCENDIRVITAYIDEQIQICGDINKIPMTNTGRVRNYVRHECYYTNKSHKKSNRGKYIRYRKIMEDLTIDLETYTQLKRAFMGGFTHASNRFSGLTVEGVDSIDLTSSYPTVMVSEFFPMSRPRPLEINSLEHLRELAKKYCLVFDLKLEGVYNKIGYESYISESRCFSLKGATVDNGRVFQAEELTTTITEIDFEIISAVYGWENISVKNVTGFVKGRLPKAVVKSILDLYKGKTELKGIEGKEVEYLLSKGMLNSIYGMCVTDILQDEFEYNAGWRQVPIDAEELIKEYNEAKKRFLYYPWGVWVTAYARKNVWSAIINLGEDYIYCDTDSIKMVNYESHKPFIEAYNKNIQYKLDEAVKDLKLEPEKLAPLNKNGDAKPLGIWEHEGHYSHFKTLGAKRYLYREDGKFALVVAGLSKQKGMDYMLNVCNNDPEKVFEMFNDNLHIPAEETGKMTHTYIDVEAELTVEDYLGQSEIVNPKSSIHLEPCEFTLSIADHYAKFLQMFAKGYVYKGVKYQ